MHYTLIVKCVGCGIADKWHIAHAHNDTPCINVKCKCLDAPYEITIEHHDVNRPCTNDKFGCFMLNSFQATNKPIASCRNISTLEQLSHVSFDS